MLRGLRITFRAKESEQIIWEKKILNYLFRVVSFSFVFHPKLYEKK